MLTIIKSIIAVIKLTIFKKKYYKSDEIIAERQIMIEQPDPGRSSLCLKEVLIGGKNKTKELTRNIVKELLKPLSSKYQDLRGCEFLNTQVSLALTHVRLSVSPSVRLLVTLSDFRLWLPFRKAKSVKRIFQKCIFKKCIYLKCSFAKCTRLACLLSFASFIYWLLCDDNAPF